MKKYFMLLAAAATVLAVSCAKEKNQPTPDPTPTEIEDNTPQPIRFGTNIAEVKSPITKAAIENTGWGAGQTLYVYGFRNASITEDAAYIKNQPATAPATFVNTNPGVRESITVEKSAGHPYYYENNVVYSFYGYYIGTATETAAPAFGTAGLTSTVTIDGTQDIMLADTDKFDDYLYAQDQLGAANVTVSIEKVYSEVSARQGVVPDLKFKHQLARFKFETMYGGNGNADDINIVNIQMKSVKVGTLTIASDNGNQGFVATGTWPAHDGQPGADGKYGFTDDNSFTLKTDANNVATGNPGNGVFAPLGESIMTFPQGLGGTNNDESPVYHLLLTLTQKGRYQANSTTDLEEFYVPMDIDFSKVVDAQQHAIPNKYAEAGKMYVIRLVIYGSEQIDMTVSLEDWEYGGETQVDPDQDTRPVPTITVKNKENNAVLTAISPLHIGDANAYDHINATAEYGTTPTSIASSEILFASSDKKVATVTTSGKVTGVSAGTCKIYVYVNGTDDYQGALATVNVTVDGGIAVPDPASTLSGLAATYTIDGSVSTTWDIPGSNPLMKVQVGGANATTQPATFSYASGNEAIATVSNAGVVTAVADGIVNITISWAAEAGEYAAGSFVVAVTVENTLPVPGFTGLQTADINATGVATNAYVTGALFTSCQYGTTPTDVAAASISIEVSPVPASGSITYNTADKTITVAQGTTANTYAVTLKVAASAGVHQAVDATPFDIVVTD